MIGDSIEIKVLSVDRDQIRVGISAPREIPVHREEVFEAIIHQNQLASQSNTPPKELVSRFKKQ